MKAAIVANASDALLVLGGLALIAGAFLLWLWLGLLVTGVILIGAGLFTGTQPTWDGQPGVLRPVDEDD